ncbi:DEAD-box helicase Dbp80-like [Centruroides sculpturatus]|uniref:DEAD-box helicase Dbp80-like n=1 Tax=Centruroides sculpturatus TaxID=218467 RepID=UPI000C6E9B66|nr:DEAD-box helicase Dbp80-like [Centruroides sculpturatus]
MDGKMANWGLWAEHQEKSLSQKFESIKIKSANDVELAVKIAAKNSTENSVVSGKPDEPEISLAEESLMRKFLHTKLVRTFQNVEVERKNPNSPLYSVKSFEELNLRPELLRGVYEMGFNAPSKIQETTVPTLLANPAQNLIAQSQSGTGKTAAFLLAGLNRVDPHKRFPQLLILSPTYELAEQTGCVAKQMTKFCSKIGIRLAVRGETLSRGEKIWEQVIIGTPGKMLDWSRRFKLFDLKKIKVFVLDEADIMIATQGHHDQSIRIHNQLSPECQMMMFSATYTEEIIDFAKLIVPNAVVLRLKKEDENLNNIKQYYVFCRNIEEKFNALSNIYGVLSVGQAIIFCQTRRAAAWLSEKMRKEGHAVALLSGDLSIEQRIAVIKTFRDAKVKVLITTNVCARGIDIEQVTLVVNFDLPVDQYGNVDCQTYLHRIGRTGRFGKSGIAINMVDGKRTMDMLEKIEDCFKRKITRLDAEDVDQIEKLEEN